jgi:hypothetical protein
VALTLRGSGVCFPPAIWRVCALPDVRVENLNQSRPVSYRAIREPRGVKAWALFPLRRGGGGASGVVAHPAWVFGVVEPWRKSQSSRAGAALLRGARRLGRASIALPFLLVYWSYLNNTREKGRFAIRWQESSPSNGLRYLRWGGDGEAVQPEK